MRILRRGALAAGAVGLAACAPNLADQASKAPSFDRPGEAKCGVAKSQSEPLIVEWPSAARAKLEALSRTGVVAVHYSGCEMEVLASCNAPGKYAYTAITPKHDHVAIKNEDDLYANIPLGAAKLEGKLQTAGELDVDMSLVGRYASDQTVVRADQLQGPDCEKATHVVSALTVGAFDFFAGSGATVGGSVGVGNVGGGASQQSSKELLNSDGRMKSCDSATTSDKTPPDGCGAILRLEVVPLGDAKRQAAAPPKPGAPAEAGAVVPNTAVGGELAFEVPEKDNAFNVSVEADGKTLTCDKPVTYYQPCHLFDLHDGKAHVTVTGTSKFERDIRVTGDGRTSVQVLHRGHGQEIVFGLVSAVGLAAVAFSFANGEGLSSGTGGNPNPDFVLNLTALAVGAGFAVVFLPGFIGGLVSAHDGLMVNVPGSKGPEMAGIPTFQWGGLAAPTTLRF
jgi:hypothetical protein